MHLPLAGYFAKRPTRPGDWPGPPHVKEICSVSNCLAPAPAGWIERWQHNGLGFYNSPTAAEAAGFEVFAYRILPVKFTKSGQESYTLPDLAVAPAAGFVSIGFDAVSRSQSFFECSPLSCNYLAKEMEVNESCLIAGLDQAIATAERFAREEPEPGPYYVIEVLRKL